MTEETNSGDGRSLTEEEANRIRENSERLQQLHENYEQVHVENVLDPRLMLYAETGRISMGYSRTYDRIHNRVPEGFCGNCPGCGQWIIVLRSNGRGNEFICECGVKLYWKPMMSRILDVQQFPGIGTMVLLYKNPDED